MSKKDLKYISTVKRGGANWEIYTQRENGFIDIWIKKEGYGLMDYVIGVFYTRNWRDVTAGCIMDAIDATKDDPRYE